MPTGDANGTGPGARLPARPGRWLLFAYFTGVDGMAGSLHIDRIVSELRDRGHQVDVITGPVGTVPDDGYHQVCSLSPSGIRFELRHFFRKKGPAARLLLKPLANLLLAPFYLLEKILYPAEPAWSWALPAARKGSEVAGRTPPDVIFSTSGPYSAHVAAARVAKRTGAPWIAEHRDPLVHPGVGRGALETGFLARLEKRLASEAAAAVYVTEAARVAAARRVAFRGRTVCIYAGAPDTGPMPPCRDTGRLCILHLGTLSKTRNLAPMVAALDLLSDSRPGVYRDLEILQVGFSNQNVIRQARRHPDVLTIRDRVPFAQVDALMRDAHILLLVQDHDDFSSETIPSKVYEYLHTGRPVLAVVHRNPELTGMLNRLGHWPVELENPKALADVLAKLHGLWKNDQLDQGVRPSPYTISTAVDRLESLAGAARDA